MKAEIGEDPMTLSMPVKNPRLHLGNSKVMGGEWRVASELHRIRIILLILKNLVHPV